MILIVTNNTELKTSQTVYFEGNFTITDGSEYKATAGISTFRATSAQTITIGTTAGESNAEFWQTYFDNGGSANPKTVNGDIISQREMYIYDDATVNDAGNNHTLNGLRLDGECNFSGTITSVGGTFYDNGGDGDFTIGTADLICQYLHVGTNDIMRVNGNVTVGIEDNTDHNYLVINNGSQLIANGNTLLVKDNKSLYVRGANNFPSGFATITLEELSFVRYDENIDQTVKSDVVYGRLYLNNRYSDSGYIKTATGDLDVRSNVYLYNLSTLDLGNFDHHIKGHIINTDDAHGNGTITTTGGTVYLDAPDSDQYIYNAGTGSYTFNNLIITNTAPSVARNKRLYDNITVNGNLIVTNSGGNEANRVNFDINDFTITGGNNFTLGSDV